MQPPDYLVDGLIMRGLTYTLTGNTGHGKTLLALLLAIRVACGEWFAGRACRRGKVVFFAAENPDNVRIQFYSMCRDMGISPDSVDIHWHAGPFSLAESRAAVIAELATHDDVALCVFDSLQAFFEGDDDNQNMAMLNLALDFRDVTAEHPNRPASLIIAHPTKKAGHDNLLPRGGSAITNELDGNLTCWAEGGIVELHNQGKFRGVPFDPIKFEMVVVKPEGLLDARGNQMACTVIKPLGEEKEAEMRRQAGSREIAALEAIEANPAVTQHELAAHLGISRTSTRRIIASLSSKRWIRDYSGRKKVMAEGQKALELARK